MTYSILARDAETGQLGAAVQSHFLAAGRSVLGAVAGVGAVATQANVLPRYRSDGIRMLAAGADAAAALSACLAADPDADLRQVGFLDSRGGVAVHTGAGCWSAASHHLGAGVCAQANTVADPGIPEAMVTAFSAASGSLADRLLAALDAAEALGGDLRGRQSAAIRVVGAEAEEDDSAALLDLRVDNSAEPLTELREAVGIAHAFTPMWDVIRGPACRGPVPPDPVQTDEALAVLEAAQRIYGAGNPEPSFWRAVALWRGGRRSEAEAAINDVARTRAGWAVLFEDVVSRWPIPS